MNISDSEIETVAAGLLGKMPDSVTHAGGGGNSRIYRIECGGELFALKMYPSIEQDKRDRLGNEKKTLHYFARHGFSDVPRMLADKPGYALLSWVEGPLVTAPTLADIDQSLDFLRRIAELSRKDEVNALPAASEACLSGAEIERQLMRRLERLAPAAEAEPVLGEFLNGEFHQQIEHRLHHARQGYKTHGLSWDADITPAKRCLIPADFGFHNALKQPDGSLVFIDFEYFGWDDPVKLTADFLLHPAMQLPENLRERFSEGMQAIFASDPDFSTRLALLTPCFGLRWTLILLNEFLPERLRARAFARGEADLEALKRRQLEKAAAMLHASSALPHNDTYRKQAL